MAKRASKRPNPPEMVTLRGRAGVFRDLEPSIGEIARTAGVDPATVRRLRNGEPVRRTSGNKVVRAIKELTKGKIDLTDDLISA